jgi:hypothetical protein
MPAPEPFTIEHFRFASAHPVINENNEPVNQIGSLYFYTDGHYRRIRLTHRDGPEVGFDYPDRTCYFCPSQETLGDMIDELDNMENPTMDDLINLARNYEEVTTNQTEEYFFVEFWSYEDDDGNVKLDGHGSRGIVSFIDIDQNDIDVIYETISELTGTVGENNETLASIIIEQNLNPVLIQSEY